MTFTYCAGLLTYECVTPRFLERMHKNPMISQGWINRRRWLIICRFFAIISIAACAYPIRAAACFNDEKWARLQANSTPSLLYVWSPRMVLSAHNATIAHTAATARGLAFWAVHDGRVPEVEINQALAQLATHPDGATRASAQALAGSQPLCSPALIEREALRHFPTAWVTPGAATGMASDVSSSVASHSPTAIVGAMPAFGWAISLAQRLPPGSANAFVSADEPAAAASQPASKLVQSGQTAPLPSQADTPSSRTAARPAKADTPPSQASAKPLIAPLP